MFIEQGVNSNNNFGKYLLGSVLIFLASVVGQIPLLLGILFPVFLNGRKFPQNSDELMHFLDQNTTLFLMLISFVFALGAVYFVIKRLHHQTLLSVTTSRKKIDWQRIFFSFTIWSIVTIVSTLVIYLVSPEYFILNFQPIPFAVLVIIGTLLIPIQTSTEEYVFRGYLMQGFGNLFKNRWMPLLMTSIIFGGMHFGNPEVAKTGNSMFVFYIGTGLFLGILTLMDEGLELALGFHAANNLVGALLVTSNWTVLQTPSIFKDVSQPEIGTDILMPVLIIYPALLYIFSRKYKWSNWKARLTSKIE